MADDKKAPTVIKGKESPSNVTEVTPQTGSAFKKVLEDEKEEYVLVNGELMLKGKKPAKLAEEAEQETEAQADARAEEEAAEEIAALPQPKDLDDGTPLGKIKAKKAAKAIEAARAKARKRVSEITNKKKTAFTKIKDYDEFIVIIEEAAELYPRCDFAVGEHQVNVRKGENSEIKNRFYVTVTRPGGTTRNMSISENEVTFEHLITFLDEACI